MKSEGGSIILYGLIALAVLGTLSGIAYKIRESGKESVRLEWAEANRKQEEANRREAAERDKITKTNEAENAKRHANLDARYRAALRGLRDKSGGDSAAKPLSAAASILACPDRQADAAGRLERLEEGILGLLERGDKAIARTITCYNWLNDQAKVNVR